MDRAFRIDALRGDRLGAVQRDGFLLLDRGQLERHGDFADRANSYSYFRTCICKTIGTHRKPIRTGLQFVQAKFTALVRRRFALNRRAGTFNDNFGARNTAPAAVLHNSAKGTERVLRPQDWREESNNRDEDECSSTAK